MDFIVCEIYPNKNIFKLLYNQYCYTLRQYLYDIHPKKIMVFFHFRDLSWHPALTTKSKMRDSHSHAFIDLTEDFTAGELQRNEIFALICLKSMEFYILLRIIS